MGQAGWYSFRLMNEQLRSRLAAGRPAYGVWCALDCPTVIEAIGTLAVDWVLIDCEHGMSSADQCVAQLQALAASQASAIVRLPKADPSLAGRVLDAGADGILVPRVDDAQTAEAMVAACRYPPLGRRGIGPHRASGYFQRIAEYLGSANDQVSVIVQIESREAVDAIDAIAAVDGLDAVFIGPADLSASLGHFGNPGAPEVQEAVAHVLARARDAGVATGYYCASPKEAVARVEQGFQMVNAAHDLGALMAGVGRALRVARGES